MRGFVNRQLAVENRLLAALPPEDCDRLLPVLEAVRFDLGDVLWQEGEPTGSSLPPWATAGDFFSVTRTHDELSVVCRQEAVPEGFVCERGWRCLLVAGSMPFTLVGVLASLTTPVAKAGVGVFAFSTFDTDYLLVKEGEFQKAVAALRAAGHEFEPLPESKEDSDADF